MRRALLSALLCALVRLKAVNSDENLADGCKEDVAYNNTDQPYWKLTFDTTDGAARNFYEVRNTSGPLSDCTRVINTQDVTPTAA